MKYLKYSMAVLLVCVVCSVGFTYAYNADEVPITFTAEVSYQTRADSPHKNKINMNYQKVSVNSTLASSDSTYSAQFYWEGGKVQTLSKIGVGSTATSSDGMTKQLGEVYIKVWRDSSMIGTKKLTGFTYDPNALYL